MKWQLQHGELQSVRVWLSRRDLMELASQKAPVGFVCTSAECSDSGSDDEWAEFLFERRDLRPPGTMQLDGNNLLDAAPKPEAQQ